MTTKADIGLGNVQNYDVASMPEATSNLTNKYMTPVATNHAIDSKLIDGNETTKGLLKTNTGLESNDDIDNYKSLTSTGLITLINQNNNTFNQIQLAISKLIKKSNITITSVTGINEIIATSNININLLNVNSIFTFIASSDNTSSVTFTLNGSSLPVTLWNEDSLSSDNIKANNKYALMPFNNRLILLNPTIEQDNSYVTSLINNHISNVNPHSQYLTSSQVQAIYDIGFKGSYVGEANLTGINYACILPSVTVTAGLFAIKFMQANAVNNTLTINNISKPLKDFNGAALPVNEFTTGEIRVVINTPDSYRVHSVKAQVNLQLTSINASITSLNNQITSMGSPTTDFVAVFNIAKN